MEEGPRDRDQSGQHSPVRNFEFTVAGHSVRRFLTGAGGAFITTDAA